MERKRGRRRERGRVREKKRKSSIVDLVVDEPAIICLERLADYISAVTTAVLSENLSVVTVASVDLT